MSTEGSSSSVMTSREEKIEELFDMLTASFEERGDDDAVTLPDELQFLTMDRGKLRCEQIGEEDGFINYIYRISEGGGRQRSVVVKWARQTYRYAEAAGLVYGEVDDESMGAMKSLDRNVRDCAAMRWMEDLVPGSTPAVYWVDERRHFYVMQDLAGYVTLRQQLSRGLVHLDTFRKIANILASLHRATRLAHLSEGERARVIAAGSNPAVDVVKRACYEMALCSERKSGVVKMREWYSEGVRGMYGEVVDNAHIAAVVGRLRVEYETKVCYTHNDTHPGSFLIKPAEACGGDVRVIDFECAGVGNNVKDVGYVLGEVIMFYHMYRRCDPSGGSGRCEWLVAAVRAYIEEYLRLVAGCGDLVPDTGYFMSHVAAYAAHYVCLQTVGFHSRCRAFQGMDDRAEVASLRAALRVMRRMDEITMLEKFISAAFT